jgi:transcription initiation factor TFIIIB Brf1 subunit/transcription initiation factor TFIIB
MEKIGTRIGGVRDSRGRPLTIERKIMFSRLKKHNMSLAADRLSELKNELERLRSVMGIPKPCVEQALEICKQALQKEIPISVEALAAAALYMACRMMNMPRPLDEFTKYLKVPKEKVARFYRLLLQKLDVKVPVSDPILYVSRIAGQLGLGGEVVKTAVEILQMAKRARITSGKDPAGLAAAALYMAALMHGDNRTQKDFAAAAGVTEVTVRNRYNEILKILRRQLNGFEKEVEINGKKYKVNVLSGSAELERGSRLLLRIRITVEVDGVKREYVITYGKYGKENMAVGRAYINADAPGGREADAERLSALVKALTGREPRINRRSNGRIEVVCYRAHLEGLRRYVEFADAIEEWLRQ